MSLTDKIRKLDMFGHDVRLNFNNSGHLHKTFLGGLVSLFIKTFIALYVFLKVRSLVFALDDKVNLTISTLDLTKEGVIDYNDTNTTVFWVLRKTKGS